MKISKLKYVFAFILMVAVAAVTTNVKAVSMPNDRQIKVSTIVETQLAAIEDGDEPGSSTYENLVYLFNSGYYTSDTALGAAMNPVYSYGIRNTTTGTYVKAYGLNYGNVAASREGVNYTGIGSGTDVDNKIGLGLAFGLNYLSSEQAGNQENLSSSMRATSFATQMYIWIVKAGLLGTAQETAIVNANLTDGSLGAYNNIKNSVQAVSNNPSYAYSSQQQAKENALEMRWNSDNGRYECTLTDTNGLDTMSLVNLIVEAKSGVQFSKNGNSITFYTTQQVGSVNNPATMTIYKSINNGRWVPGYASTVDNGQELVYLSDRQNANTPTYVSLYTNALRVKVSKVLGTTGGHGNTNTGDATNAGAKYGVYSDAACTQLVQELTTDSNGEAISNPLEFRDYYVKEIMVPAGCKIDTQVHPALKSDAREEANGQKIVSVSSTDEVIYGGFRMIVSFSDLSGNTTKDPSVGSVIKLALNSRPSESYTTTVDEHGYADFTNIPYGMYTCTEIERPAAHPELDLMDPMDIFIDSEETYIYSKLVNNEVAQRLIRIVKKDAETGNVVPVANTAFKVKDSKGEYVKQKVMYPNVETLEVFKTDSVGQLVMPEELPYGTYTVEEVTAPTGYYNECAATGKASGTFKVEANTVEEPDKEVIVVCEISNEPQKAVVNISTRGQVLTGTNTETQNGKTVKRPAYGEGNIPGAVYRVTAKEDIVSGDTVTVFMRAGEYQDFTADQYGKVSFKLHIGTYTIEQISVPEGYVLNKDVKELVVSPKEQTIKEWDENFTFSNIKQSFEVNFEKEFEDMPFYRQNQNKDEEAELAVKYSKVLIGIYAAEDITNVSGEVKIAKDTLVDVVSIDNDGKGKDRGELPVGKFYAKELETDENYEVSDQTYEIVTKPTNNSDAEFVINVDKIVNKPKLITKLLLTKIEEVSVLVGDEQKSQSLLDRIEDFAEGVLEGLLSDKTKTTPVVTLEGAEFVVEYKDDDGNYYPLLEKVNGELVEVVRTTDENGEIVINGLPFGSYQVREIKAPRYYDLDSEKAYKFTLTALKPEIELAPQDARSIVDLTVGVKDEDGTVLEGVQVDLIDPDTNEVVYSEETDENGVANFEQIRAGRYIRKVSGLEKQYVVPEDAEVYAESTGENNYEVVVKYITGKIVVFKTDAETGEPVPGCNFKVTDEAGNVVAEGQSDENGYFIVEGLRYGVYYVEETEAAEGYEKSGDIFEVSIEEDGAEYVVDFTNVPTGDIAVIAYVMVALISLGVIARTVKKMKMN